ncbi:MAG: rhomboid family intramembrane serine protease [Roseivirga sp.]
MLSYSQPARTMQELVGFLKFHFQRAENGLMQLMLLNVLCFMALLVLKVALVVAGYEAIYPALYHALALPAAWATFCQQPWTLLTHMWVHTSLFATFWRLLLLYAFGQVIMQRLGSRHLVVLYLLGGLAGGGFFLLLYNVAPHFKGIPATLTGFSGSLYAVMVAAALLAPQRPFQLFLLGFFQLQYIVGFLVLLAFFDLAGEAPAESTAHLGGALLGYAYVQQLKGLPPLRQRWNRLTGRRSSTLKVTYRHTHFVASHPLKAKKQKLGER